MSWLVVTGFPTGGLLPAAESRLAAWAVEDSAAFDSSYKQSGKLAGQLAQRYEGAIRQTLVRLAEVARQDPADLSRNPLAIETTGAPWPIVTYMRNGERLTVIPDGRASLSLDDFEQATARKTRIVMTPSSIVVTAAAGVDRVTAAEIPRAAFMEPLDRISLGDGTAVFLLDNQGRSLGRATLASEEQELVKSVASESMTTLISKTSVLSLARVPAAGWTVIVRVPLAEAYRGVAFPALDERSLPNPLYLVKRSQGASLEGVGKGLLYSFGGLAILVVALLLLRRRLRGDARLRMKAEANPSFPPTLTALQSGGLAVLEALVGEKNHPAGQERKDEPALLPALSQPSAPAPAPAPVQLPPDGATSGVWRDTLQAQVSYLLGEFRQMQEQMEQQMQVTARQPQVDALQARMEAELDSFAEALRQRLELEARHYEALRAQQAHFAEVNDGKFGMLESEIEGYRNQGMQADRQANERIQVLAQAVQQLHTALTQSQRENAQLREELGALSARVHRIVQLLAKGKTA